MINSNNISSLNKFQQVNKKKNALINGLDHSPKNEQNGSSSMQAEMNQPIQNRLDSIAGNPGTASENLPASKSSISDINMAKETMERTKNGILSNAAQAMLAQANQLPEGVHRLLTVTPYPYK